LQAAPNFKHTALKPILDAKVSPETEQIHTDGASGYLFLIPKDKHIAGNHTKELRESGMVSNRTIEAAFSLFKRGVVGSYHKLGEDHLDRYLDEFCWRYNRRRSQARMFDTALASVAMNKPLPYKALTKQDDF
jgi:hypothetical protein